MHNDQISCLSAGDRPFTGNVLPLLHEIRHALQRLIASGETHVIDLQALPLAPGEEARVEELLGEGEVTAHLRALGPSEIRETAIPGVWLVTHRNEHDAVVGRHIEITRCPAILPAQTEDLPAAMARIGAVVKEMEQEGEE